jgi:acetyl esterase/lipase
MTDVTQPQLLVFQPEGKGPHPAVMVCPGGSYGVLATDLEGTEVAHWLNTQGFVAAVLHYRVPNKREGAYQDAQRALSLLRSRASEFSIDPNRLGVLGFSAGGHLAARLATGFAKRAYPTMDAVDSVSCRPDFALLIYPAYLEDKAAGGIAPEVKPQAGTPPMFLAQTADDPYLDVLAYAQALKDAGIPVRCVLYERGGHGYGLRTPADQPSHRWAAEAADWLQRYAAPGQDSRPTQNRRPARVGISLLLISR